MSADRRKLIVVSNRGPASFGRGEDGTRTARRGGGGLVTALRSLVSHHDVTWVASAITPEDHVVAGEGPLEETALDGSPYRLRLVSHDANAYDWYYNVVSNPTLWFLQHYLWDLKVSPGWDHGLHRAWNDGYVPVNRGFADVVLEELEREPGATVFFHDYHLYLAPRFVRDSLDDALLAHFVHIPWAQPDYWRVLPEPIRHAIHDGLLANDVVGFHTTRWQRSFLRSSQDIVGAKTDNERGVGALPRPQGASSRRTRSRRTRRSSTSSRPIRGCSRPSGRSSRAGPRSSSSASTGAIRRRTSCAASAPSSSTSTPIPRCTGGWRMLALLDPSRQDIPEYAEYLGAIQREARRVNDRFVAEGWTAIDLRIADNFHQSVAAYKQYDVLLVNAIFDGLNLVAKEAPLVNARNGVLVLSENTGAHEELAEWAITVNPFDVAGQAEAIHEALELPEDERARRLEAIRAHVREHDLAAWIAAQLAGLEHGVAPAKN